MKFLPLTFLFFTTATPLFSEPIEKEIQHLLGRYCLDCHDADTQMGDLDLERFTSVAYMAGHAKVWENVLRQIGDGEMPPKKKFV